MSAKGFEALASILDDANKGAAKRDAIIEDNAVTLRDLARKSVAEGRKPSEILMICVSADDPKWHDVVELLKPAHNWQQYRDRGVEAIVCAAAPFEIFEIICDRLPEQATPIIDAVPGEDEVKLLALAGGGFDLYMVIISSEP